jgi:antitoxin (DNA-binding transcriptional repressor) of toxin-antitoxin stability system
VKVKTAELKNNLSRYLRRVRETGETIVVYDRDKPIAMLGPLPERELVDPKQKAEIDEMQIRFAEAGLELRRPTVLSNRLPKIKTTPAPDSRTDIDIVAQIRRSRDW